MTEAIENQVERFAPGFRDTVVERVTKNAVQMEQWNPNHVGGDISNGEASFTQMLARPVPRWNTYKTPVRGHLPRLGRHAARVRPCTASAGTTPRGWRCARCSGCGRPRRCALRAPDAWRPRFVRNPVSQ